MAATVRQSITITTLTDYVTTAQLST